MEPIMCNFILQFISSIIAGIFSAYLFIILLKLYFRYSLSGSLGTFVHSNVIEDSIVFKVSFNWRDFATPIPRVCLKISRTNGDDNEDWEGSYYSDMLNPHKLTGGYTKSREKLSEEDLGWHEITLFPDKRTIALLLHFVVTDEEGKKTWITNNGYFIHKKNNQNRPD